MIGRRIDCRFGFAGLVCLMLLPLSAGCVVRPTKPLAPQEHDVFRAKAVKVLEEAAFGDSPAGRMHALEAFKEVAPREGMDLLAIPLNIENLYAGASFAALVAVGEISDIVTIGPDVIELVRTRAEHVNPSVRIGALFALHRLGDKRRTGELASFLLDHRDARVRANAAMVIGRLGGNKQVTLLRQALRREKKDLTKLQILESLAALGDEHAANRLVFNSHSSRPQQAAAGLMALANSKVPDAEDVFLIRLHSEDFPEIQLQAARGLARLDQNIGLEIAIRHLSFDSPQHGVPNDPPQQQIDRVRGLAALALESMGEPQALGPLREAFDDPGQTEYVRIAVARAAIRTIDHLQRLRNRASGQLADNGVGGDQVAAQQRNRP